MPLLRMALRIREEIEEKIREQGRREYRQEYIQRLHEAVERFGYYASDGQQVLPLTPEVKRFLDGDDEVEDEPAWVIMARKWRILEPK